jgi:hypothetical protein
VKSAHTRGDHLKVFAPLDSRHLRERMLPTISGRSL